MLNVSVLMDQELSQLLELTVLYIGRKHFLGQRVKQSFNFKRALTSVFQPLKVQLNLAPKCWLLHVQAPSNYSVQLISPRGKLHTEKRVRFQK